MIQEQYVSFETAKMLKEKGFDELCYMYYPKTGGEVEELSLHELNYERENFIKAPTQQLTMCWLREVHHLNIEPYFEYYLLGYSAEIKYTNKDTPLYLFEYLREKWFNTYEEACEEAIKYCLEKLI